MLAIAMDVAQNALNDLWALSTSVAVICYIMTTTLLLYILNFDHELPGNEKVGIVVIFFAISVVLACIYMQMHKKIRACKNIFGEKQVGEKQVEEKQVEEPIIGGSADSIGEEKETDAFKSLLRFSPYVRRNSSPLQFQEEFSCRAVATISAPNTFIHENLCLSKTDLKCAAPKNSNGTSFKDTDEIPVILHNCVKGLGDVIEHVKLLNDAYVETIEDAAVAIENSMTTVEERNSNSKFPDEEKSLQCNLQSTDDLEKLTDTSENTCSIHPDMSQDLNNVQKPKKNSKIDSRNQNPQRLGFSKLLSENLCSYIQNVSEDATQEFLSKPAITVTDGSEPFLIKIPSREHQLHSVINLKPELDMGKKKISIRFYKTKSPVTQIGSQKVSVKRLIPKLPMRPYVGKITMSQFLSQRANSKKRYETLISKSETIISKNLPTISKKKPVISVNELMISMNESLITDMDKPSISIHEPLISKFEQTDYKKFADILKDYADYCRLHPTILRQRLQNPRIAPFPKWESYTYPEF